ncbi:MAG: adenylyltransferase/cytidyltransferase family protein, partial [Legionellaceae bacterium]|nr:adenylyltransferase/cytidyltransferase family protein [Legionellaceae bacterium]
MSSIALYGGTFDPVHEGHLKTAQYLKTQLAFDSLLLMPCKTALLKADASASPEQRAAMLQLAIQDYP